MATRGEGKKLRGADEAQVSSPMETIVERPESIDLAARLGDIVALLMRSPTYRYLSLADLEWLIVPAILTGQFSIMSARGKTDDRLRAPIGLAIWASVSDEVDRKLEAQKRAGLVPFRLAPADWKSGETLWLLDIIAIREVKQAFLAKLGEGPFKGRDAKRYFREPGKPEEVAVPT